ncbi:capsular polysaccharide biosynthesis protein [Endozoicomonas lisbonensis]|uniref:Capsular polysaccharide export protein n=1 Tax=Endozoicomonas lisbonensis TaxID=3120522 RepID=A0ABV2SH19_9GAMM
MSQFITFSKGISGARELEPLIGKPVSYVNLFQQLTKKHGGSGVTVLGWGRKNNTTKAKAYSQKNNLPYWSLEDGFISYLGHPALGDRRFSLIVDKSGIYYDATQSSDIEHLLNHPEEWLTEELKARSANLLESIRKHQITKYNHEPVSDWKAQRAAQQRVLVVDQTYGDCSVKYGMADDSSFKAMLEAALSENPDSEVWVKVHPDVVLGKKKGYFKLEPCGQKIKGFDSDRLKVLSDKINAQSLFPHFSKVYVVTSQLGFEALWYGKEVVCFGVPFYSGWSLTDDRIGCPRRTVKHTVESLFAAACLKYTRYIDPESVERCELEDIVDLVALQRQYQTQEVSTLYAVDFSLWKRAFLHCFIGGRAGRIQFVRSTEKALETAIDGDGILLWGAKQYEFKAPEGIALWRAEDAFIRSNGLGAELRRPGSLIIDKQGMYFDCTRPSDLEIAINTIKLSDRQIERGSQLVKTLVQQRVSKYNLPGSGHQVFADATPQQKKILVTGQVNNDASLKWGSPAIHSNLDLLKAVRASEPNAYIVYKPHPDVLLAGREGHIPEPRALQWADSVVSDSDILDCIDQCDELHVMTSLAGFEALIRGKRVHCWGAPFYSGWGLTIDHLDIARRTAKRSLAELTYFVHCYYPCYVHWGTRRFTTVERMVRALKQEAAVHQTKSGKLYSWLARTKRKAGYLIEVFTG